MKTTLLTGFLITSFGIFANAQSTSTGDPDLKSKWHYKIVNRIHVDSDFRWDYASVDEATNRLYISRATMVQVLDLGTSKVIATIPNTNGVHGIALAQDLNKGFISDGKDSAVTIFDLKTNAVIEKVLVTGKNPDAIVYDKVTGRVFTMNGKTHNATVIDAKTNAVIGTIALDGKPEFCVADGKGKLYVNLEDKSAIEEIDAKEMKVLRQWSIAPGMSPTGLAIDTKNRRLFSTCGNEIMVISDANKGTVITTLPIGEGSDAAAFDPEKMRIFSSNEEGNLTVVQDSADTYRVLETFPTERWSRTMAINTKTHHIYLPSAIMKPLHPVRAGMERPRPQPRPGTFVILDVEPIEKN